MTKQFSLIIDGITFTLIPITGESYRTIQNHPFPLDYRVVKQMPEGIIPVVPQTIEYRAIKIDGLPYAIQNVTRAMDVEKHDKITIAANYTTKEEDPFGMDTLYGGLAALMLHRRHIARELLKSNPESAFKALNEMFDDCNKKIKEILAL